MQTTRYKYFIKYDATFRSFKLSMTHTIGGQGGTYINWYGPRRWADEIICGCNMWINNQCGMDIEEFLDKLDIGRTTPKGTHK